MGLFGRSFVFSVFVAATLGAAASARQQSPAPAAGITILKPARVFDGETLHEGWAVRVRGDRIDAVGAPATTATAGASVLDLPNTTILPGLIEGHSHVLLHATTKRHGTTRC